MSIYLQIPGIDGDVTASGLQKHIEVESVDFDIRRHMNTQPGVVSDREGARPTVSEITLTKRTDKTTPHLFTEATTGTTKPQVTLKFVNTGKELSEYLTMTLSNVMISGYNLTDQGVKDNQDNPGQKPKPRETVRLNFDKIEVKYTPYDAQHNAGSPIPAGYDLQTAQAC